MSSFAEKRRSLAMVFVIGCCLVGANPAQAEHEVGTRGYFRIGAGFTGAAEDRACFQAPGADWKYRLGNECDTWIEGGIYDAYKPKGDDGPLFYTEFWIGRSAAEGRQRLFRFENTTQLYIQASNIAALGRDTKVWIGRKYYQRHDIHINDFYWSEILGDGFGVEDIQLPFGKLMYAYTRNSDSVEVTNTATPAMVVGVSEAFQNNHDLRYNMPLSITGKGSVTVQLMFAHSAGNDGVMGLNDATSTRGLAVGAWFEETFPVGNAKLSAQYGRGLLRNKFRGSTRDLVTTLSSDQADDLFGAYILRFTGQTLINPSPRVAVFASAVFQKEDGTDYQPNPTDLTWYSFGIRPMLFIDHNFRVLAEYGFDRTDNKTGDNDVTGNLHKVTLAGELSIDVGFWTRPVIRLFTTAATWSSDFEGLLGASGQGDDTQCLDRTNCFSAGVQAEYWW
ncbi:MAG: carbohydrate porin [Proteobacteria bacterium]|nr:carbohydrate porin [Pseudomonadota bacterium]